MKKTLLPIILTVCFCACKPKDKFVLQAEMNDSIAGPILVVYDDPVSKLDTIYPENGRFGYSFVPDTVTLFRLVSPKAESIPVVAEKGTSVHLKGSFAQPIIESKGMNGEYGQFLKTIQPIRQNKDSLQREAREFIRLHPQSFFSAYLVNQYFVQTEQPDIQEISQLIEPLGGTVKDSRILGVILKNLPDTKQRNNTSTGHVSYFSCKNRKGEYVSWSNTPDSYTLINFWASWDDDSRTVRDSLEKHIKEFPEERFKVMNLSLDYDNRMWQKACKKDSKQWIEICDFKGWGNTVVKQNNICKLPANILVDRNRKIITTNLFGNELYDKIRNLLETKKKP